MTTYYNFTPSVTGPYQFQPTLDGDVYNATVTWSLFGARYYINIYDLSGTLIVSQALIGSSVGVNIASVTWANDVATVVTATPHGYLIGSTANLTMTGATPVGYNGTFECIIIDNVSFKFDLTSVLGPVTIAGVVFYNISMTAGYFNSTLVFRPATQQFKVSP